MPGDLISVATVPDRATAELLEEVLHDGGIERVDLKSGVGVAYMPRPNAVEYEVRVHDVDEARARQILADFEEQSGQAATSQADHAAGSTPTVQADDDELPASGRKRWVFWVAMAFVLVWVGPLLWSALLVLSRFVRGILE